jgi:hypothetical protein
LAEQRRYNTDIRWSIQLQAYNTFSHGRQNIEPSGERQRLPTYTNKNHPLSTERQKTLKAVQRFNATIDRW